MKVQINIGSSNHARSPMLEGKRFANHGLGIGHHSPFVAPGTGHHAGFGIRQSGTGSLALVWLAIILIPTDLPSIRGALDREMKCCLTRSLQTPYNEQIRIIGGRSVWSWRVCLTGSDDQNGLSHFRFVPSRIFRKQHMASGSPGVGHRERGADGSSAVAFDKGSPRSGRAIE